MYDNGNKYKLTFIIIYNIVRSIYIYLCVCSYNSRVEILNCADFPCVCAIEFSIKSNISMNKKSKFQVIRRAACTYYIVYLTERSAVKMKSSVRCRGPGAATVEYLYPFETTAPSVFAVKVYLITSTYFSFQIFNTILANFTNTEKFKCYDLKKFRI